MPTYRYRRPDGSTFEVLQKFSDAPLTEDPRTGVPVQRVISGGTGVQFKGSGFYETDYVRKGAGEKGEKKASGGSESNESGGSGSSKKAESGSASAKSSSGASE